MQLHPREICLSLPENVLSINRDRDRDRFLLKNFPARLSHPSPSPLLLPRPRSEPAPEPRLSSPALRRHCRHRSQASLVAITASSGSFPPRTSVVSIGTSVAPAPLLSRSSSPLQASTASFSRRHYSFQWKLPAQNQCRLDRNQRRASASLLLPSPLQIQLPTVSSSPLADEKVQPFERRVLSVSLSSVSEIEITDVDANQGSTNPFPLEASCVSFRNPLPIYSLCFVFGSRHSITSPAGCRRLHPLSPLPAVAIAALPLPLFVAIAASSASFSPPDCILQCKLPAARLQLPAQAFRRLIAAFRASFAPSSRRLLCLSPLSIPSSVSPLWIPLPDVSLALPLPLHSISPAHLLASAKSFRWILPLPLARPAAKFSLHYACVVLALISATL